MSVLRVRGLSKQYPGVKALDNVSLEVGEGEVFGFLGPNGAGKTTFTKCVAGFVKPSQGTVHINGVDALRNPVEASKYIGLVPDQYEFYPNLTGIQHLEFYGRLHGIPRAAREERIEDLLRLLRMSDRAHRRVKGYSHGMKQRICIAQALLHKPKLIFFDEPTNGLDPQGAYELREMIRGLSKDGTSIFLNSHGLHEVEQVCERVAILHNGTMRMTGAVGELKSRAQGGVIVSFAEVNPSVKSAVAALNRQATWEKTKVTISAKDNEIPAIVQRLVQGGAKIMSVQQGSGLEEAFLQLTEGK